MALLGMQADMQYQNYFRGHYSSMDLNLDASGNTWPFNTADTFVKTEQCCNGTLSLSSPDHHWVYNKEALKQTMLQQQTIFKDQVHELHRLYWKQKELMDGMRRNKLQNYNLNLESLQSNPHLSQKSYNQLFASTAENSQLRSTFSEGKSAHAGFDHAETKFSLEDCQLESKCKKFGKKILDLELPAYEYIDSEEEGSVSEVSGYPQGGISEVVQTSNHLPYCENSSFNSVLNKDYSTADTISSKKNILADLNEPLELEKEADPMSTYLADLNEPINPEEEATPITKFVADLNEPFKLQEEIASRSTDFPSLSTGHWEFPYQDLSQKSNSAIQVLPTDILQNTELRRDCETGSNGLQLEENKIQKWSYPGDEAGQSRSGAASLSSGFSKEEVYKSLEDVELNQAHEIPSSFVIDQSKQKSDSECLQSLGKELSPNSYPELASCQLISLTDVGDSEASFVSNGRKHFHDFVRTPIAVQALPCFNSSVPSSKSSRSSFTSPRLTEKKSRYSKNVKSCPKFDGTRFHKHSNGFNSESKTLESPLPSIDCNGIDCSNSDDLTSEQHGYVKSAKDMNSNFTSHSSDGEKRIEDSTEGLLWLKTKSICKGKCGKRSDSSTQVESVLLQANSACTFEVEMEKVDTSNDSSSKRLLGGEEVTSKELVVGDSLSKSFSGFGIAIDLNSCIDEHESSPTASLSTKPDLEAPVSPENKERSPPRGESEENQVDTPSQMSGQEDGDVRENFGGSAVVSGHEDRDAQEDLLGNVVEAVVSGQVGGGNVKDEIVKDAVTALISISSSKVQTCPEMTTCGPSEPCSSEDLYWFARVASQLEDDPNSEFGVVMSSKDSEDNEDCLANGLDYFEAMTLKLTETKLEELWCMSNYEKDQNEEAMEATPLPSQPRRGRMRRAARQQRKDFQTEILPSLVSLSRSEITADLQTMEGLIEAANNSLKIDSSRTVGRNARARGGRRSSNSSSKVRETQICSQSKPQTGNKEKGNVERRLKGWGNITRPRTPRFPAGNPRVC